MTPERYNDDNKVDPARLCACGCGLPIDRTGANSKYRFNCKKRIEREQNREYARIKREKAAKK